jgi:hypothetical protein
MGPCVRRDDVCNLDTRLHKKSVVVPANAGTHNHRCIIESSFANLVRSAINAKSLGDSADVRISARNTDDARADADVHLIPVQLRSLAPNSLIRRSINALFNPR